MQRLHLVGLTEDADGLIFSTRRGAKSGGFVVTVDGDLLSTLEAAQTGGSSAGGSGGGGGGKARSNGRAPAAGGGVRQGGRPESQLSPREMQELLRAGWSLEEVAAEAGVDVDWVGRFAAPVMAEIQRVVDQALDAVFEKPRAGQSALALGSSVRRNLAERGVRLTDEDFADGWGAHQLDELTWVVTFTYTSRGRPQEAAWAIDLDEDELVARNRLATALGHVTSIRRKVSTAPPPKPKPAATAVKRAAPSSSKAAPAPARRRPAAAAAKARTAKKAAKTTKSAKATKSTKKKAGAAKRGKRPAPAPPSIDLETSVPPRPNTTSDVYRTELRRRLAIESAGRPAPRLPTPEPELHDVARPPVRGPMPPPAPVSVPPVVREKLAEPIGTFDIDHDRKEDADDSPFADEAWYPKDPPAAAGVVARDRPDMPGGSRASSSVPSVPAARPTPPPRRPAAAEPDRRPPRADVAEPRPPARPPAAAERERPSPPAQRPPARPPAAAERERPARPPAAAERERPARPPAAAEQERPAPPAERPTARRPAVHEPDQPPAAAEPDAAAPRAHVAEPPTTLHRPPLPGAAPTDPAPAVVEPERPAPPSATATATAGARVTRVLRRRAEPAAAPERAVPPPPRTTDTQPRVPVFHGATAAAPEAPRPPRRREPLRAR